MCIRDSYYGGLLALNVMAGGYATLELERPNTEIIDHMAETSLAAASASAGAGAGAAAAGEAGASAKREERLAAGRRNRAAYVARERQKPNIVPATPLSLRWRPLLPTQPRASSSSSSSASAGLPSPQWQGEPQGVRKLGAGGFRRPDVPSGMPEFC